MSTEVATGLNKTISQLFNRGGVLRMILEYLLKGSFLTAGSALFMQNLRGKVRTAFVTSLIQTIVFAFLLYLIDYVLPRFAPGLFQAKKE